MAKHKFMYDLVVIGAGSGGVRAARIAGLHGAKVALIETSLHHGPPTYTAVGGTCVNVGCVPKKLFVYGSHYAHELQDSRGFGWLPDDKPLDHAWETLVDNKNKEIDRLNGIYGKILDSAGVKFVEATGKITDQHTVVCTAANGETHELTAETILVAVGGWPFKPNIPGIEHAITSNEVFYLKERPRRVVCVGGGYIAIEFAGIFHGYGSEVSLLYRGDIFLRGFDMDIRNHLVSQMQAAGVNLKFNTDPVEIKKENNEYIVVLNTGEEIRCDCVFYGTGRLAKTPTLGLESAGVEVDAKGNIIVNEYSQTNVPNIYAVGDVTDRINLTPVALHEGHCFADTKYGGMDRKPDHELVCSAVFSQPEIGTVGLTEEEAVKKYPNVSAYTSSFTPLKDRVSGRAYRKDYMKILVNDDNDVVIGVHICAHAAAEMLQGIGIAVKMGAKKSDFDTTIGIHPTGAEELVTMRKASYHFSNGKKVAGPRL